MGIQWIMRRQPELFELLEAFRTDLLDYLPEARSAALFGGVALGSFLPGVSDVDLIVWVRSPAVSEEMEERALRLWRFLSERKYGRQVHLSVATLSALRGPISPDGAGTPGSPRSLRIYDGKAHPVEGYPLSLPDTVGYAANGITLFGRNLIKRLPSVPDDWAVRYLRIRLGYLLGAATWKSGPFGPDPAASAAECGAAGLLEEPLWWARHLYSLSTGGELMSKENASAWFLSRRLAGPLTKLVELAHKWRSEGSVSPEEILRAAKLFQPAARQFVDEALRATGSRTHALPRKLAGALLTAQSLLDRPPEAR